MSLDAGETTSLAPAFETSPLITETNGLEHRVYAATSSSHPNLCKKAPRTFDLDASNTPGETTPTNSQLNRRPVHQPEASPRKTSLWRSVRASTSLRLENSGSVARDHLASERTFLAYIRTSLAIASSGVALVQLFTVANPSHHFANSDVRVFVRPLGAVAVLLGITVLLIGVTRYFLVQAALTKGYFPAARTAIGYIALALFALVGTTFTFLVTGKVGAGVP